MELSELEKIELGKIEAAVKTLIECGWQKVTHQVSEVHLKSADKTQIVHSLKLDVCKGGF